MDVETDMDIQTREVPSPPAATLLAEALTKLIGSS